MNLGAYALYARWALYVSVVGRSCTLLRLVALSSTVGWYRLLLCPACTRPSVWMYPHVHVFAFEQVSIFCKGSTGQHGVGLLMIRPTTQAFCLAGSQLESMPDPVKNFWEAPTTPYQWKHSHVSMWLEQP